MTESTTAKALSSMNIWRSLKGLPADVWTLSVASLINRAGTMVLPFLVLYLTKQLGFSASRAGLVLAVYGAGSIIAAPISGRLSDKLGPLPVMRVALVLTGVLVLLYPVVTSYAGVIVLTLLWAISTDLFRPANLAMIADVVPPDRLKAAYALSRLAINVGMSVGPAVAGLIATRSFNWIFIVDGATTLAAAAVLIATRFDNVRHAVPGDGSKRAPSLLSSLVLDDRRMVLFLSAIFLTGIVFFQLEGPLPLFLVDELRLSPAFYGGLFTLNTVMIVFMEVPLNSATAHWPHRRALAIGAFLFAVGSGAFAFAGGAMGVIVAMIVWTFGEMMLFPQAAAYVGEIAPPARRGAYMGAYSLAFSLSFAVAPWAGTSSYAHFGAKPLWIGVFVVGSISAIMMAKVTADEPGASSEALAA
jgi:MFS family permease